MKQNIASNIKRLFYILLGAMVVSYLSFYAFLVLPSIKRGQEERELGEIKELLSTTSQQFDHVLSLAKDNAEWDSLYEILKNSKINRENNKFLGEIFTKDSLKYYKLDYMGIFDREQNEVKASSNYGIDVSDLFLQKGKKYFFTSQPNGSNRVKIASGYINSKERIYMFISHIILDSDGLGDAAGYIFFLKEISEKDIFELEVKRNLMLELYIPKEEDIALLQKVSHSQKNQNYYSTTDKYRKRVYYIPYFEGTNEIAYIIKLIKNNDVSREILLSFLTGMIPILILTFFVLHIKKIVHKKLVDPIISLYEHIVSIKKSSKYILMEYPEVKNEIDEVIEAFNHLMIEVRDQRKDIENKKIRLEELAYTDHLTGLATRRLLDEKYELLFERARRSEAILTLIMIDIDYFKKYNDRYGHQAGDHALKIVGELMMSIFKREGDIASRYGGEEFLIVLYKTSLEDALTLVENFQKKLKNLNIEHNSSPFKSLTVSVGIRSKKILKNQSSYHLLKEADQYLYKAKNSGRNKCSF